MKNPTQEQMYWRAHRNIHDAMIQFTEIQKSDNPITKDEFEKLVKKRPALWGMFRKMFE